MKQWLQSWTVMRIVRLAMAVFLIFQGIELKQWLVVGAGLLFALMPILNISSCGTQGCATRYSNPQKSTKPTTFTEIK